MAKEKICGIYCIENLVNGKKYIGQSINIVDRFYHHKSNLKNNRHINNHLQKSFIKYGFESFNYYIIEECKIGNLDDRETYWINKLNTLNGNFGYNFESGGSLNKILSDETRRKISENHIDVSGENNPFYNKKHSPEIMEQILNSEGYINRKYKGEDSHRATLTKEQVIEIKTYFKNNVSKYGDIQNLAKIYDVGYQAISHIKHNRAWSYIIV